VPHTQLDYDKPVEMFSVAPVDPGEVEKFSRANPDIQMSLNPDDELWGVPIAKNAAERDRILKYFGHVDLGKPK